MIVHCCSARFLYLSRRKPLNWEFFLTQQKRSEPGEISSPAFLLNSPLNCAAPLTSATSPRQANFTSWPNPTLSLPAERRALLFICFARRTALRSQPITCQKCQTHLCQQCQISKNGCSPLGCSRWAKPPNHTHTLPKGGCCPRGGSEDVSLADY